MRKLILAAAVTTVAIPIAAVPAAAQNPTREYQRERAQQQRECARDLRDADNRREYNRELRDCRQEAREDRREYRRELRQDWRQNYRRYDYNRYERGYNAYYPEDYYRDGRYYRTRVLSRNDRIYRGRDGRYYCRRSDGTTGLIIGAGIGALIGNSIDGGRSSLLGTLIGAGAGAAIGREIQRGNVRCR